MRFGKLLQIVCQKCPKYLFGAMSVLNQLKNWCIYDATDTDCGLEKLGNSVQPGKWSSVWSRYPAIRSMGGIL